MTEYLTATYRDGQLVLDNPVKFVEGQRVFVSISPDPYSLQDTEMRLDDAEGDDPKAIQERLNRFDKLEPLQMSDEEIAEWESARDEFRRVSLEAVRKEMGLSP